MALYLGKNKVTPVGLIGSMKFFFEANGKCQGSTATSFEGCWQYEDTENVTDMRSMFYGCSNLKTIQLFNTSKTTNMSSMFSYCGKLSTVPQFDTSKVTNMSNMFNYCDSLTTVPSFDTVNVKNMDYMFDYCSALEQIHMININANLRINSSTKFTREALLEIIGNLKAQTSGNKTLTMGATNLAKLTDEDKAIATNKGWTLA